MSTAPEQRSAPTGPVVEPQAPGGVARPRRAWLRLPLVRSLLIVIVCGALFWLASELFSSFNDLRLAYGGYYFCALAGLTLLVGLNGQISLGHGGLFAVGAYAAALINYTLHWPLLPAMVLAVVAATIVGGILGIAAARLRGPYLAGATLAFALALPGITDRFSGLFGGENGITGLLPPSIPGFLGGSNLSLQLYQAWIAGLCAAVVLFVLLNLTRSGVGRSLRAVRDDEIAAALCGIHVGRTQVRAFIVSAACAGLGGAAYLAVYNAVTPDAFAVTLSFALLAGVVIGGLGSYAGAAYGAVILVMVPSWSQDITNGLSLHLSSSATSNLPNAIYGIVLIAVMFAAPRGIQGLLLAGVHRARARRTPGPPTAPVAQPFTHMPTGGEE